MKVDRSGDGLEIRSGEEVIRIDPWGVDSLRVRAGLGGIDFDRPSALLEPTPSAAPVIERGEECASITNGAICAIVEDERGEWGPCVVVRFVRSGTGEELLSEQRIHNWWPGPRWFTPLGGGRHRIEQQFRSYDGERFFGLGQRTHGMLDQKGMVLDLVQRNAEVSIPFVLSSRGYGFLWNNPAIGRAELATNRTRWTADAGRQIDYWVTTGTPAEILGHYADATGHAPLLPGWATGFWQCRLRYRTQEELLQVAREHRRRGLPLSVIVVDFFHWTALGDWRFDPVAWPDPRAMAAELEAMGVKLMVSVWPHVSPLSENYARMEREKLLVGSGGAPASLIDLPEPGIDRLIPMALYDATNPAARALVWSAVRRNYLDNGIEVWWLDACEPEARAPNPERLSFLAGPGDEVMNLYPLAHAQAFFDGMHEAGREEVVLLCRSAWAGSQRYGAGVWSGDIPATWESLRRQVRAGLNIAISGIPWWTSDIGGFHGGDPADPDYRELIVRWFQYGAFCPLFRLHGNREPRTAFDANISGGPNEVWSYGDEAYDLICDVLRLRERMRPYLDTQMRVAHESGMPPMRPLFVDFPDDPHSWTIEDEFMLGPDVLVAPILDPGRRGRQVYLPPGCWTDAWSCATVDGGRIIDVDAPIDRIPVFFRNRIPFEV